jgi:hypothetical protein
MRADARHLEAADAEAEQNCLQTLFIRSRMSSLSELCRCNRIFLFYQPPADILFIDGQTVCSNSHAAIAVLHGSIDKSVGQYDPRFVNLLGLYSWYLYLEIFLYIVTGGSRLLFNCFY